MIKPEITSLSVTHPELAAQWHPTKNRELTPEMVSKGSEKKVWWLLPYNVPDDYPIEHLRGKHFDFEWEAIIYNRVKGLGCPYLSNPAKAIWQGFNDLATTYPDLASQWHPTKNENLSPADVMAGSEREVWWLMPYDVPIDYPIEHLRGKHFDFEWEAKIYNRANGQRCPYLSGQSVWKGFNDLATVNPELAAQWHPTKNGNLKVEMITARSGLKVWWYLPYDVPDDYPMEHLRGKHFDFEWEATIASRSHGNGCPYLSVPATAVWTGFNDLATVNPELTKQWHSTKNGNLKPTDVTAGSGKKVWWLLPYDVPMDHPIEHLRGKHFNFEWEDVIANRYNDRNCPYLSGRQIWLGFNDLKTTHPELAAQWHPTKNGDLKPTDVSAGSSKKIWWHLPYDDPQTGKHFDFEWQTFIYSRIENCNCPFLSGRAVWKGFNDLDTTHKELAKEWHPTKNGNFKPTNISAGSRRKVWWYLSYDVPMDYPVESLRGKHFDFEWKDEICNRSNNRSCPYLSGHQIWIGFNDLATTHPQIAAQWHPTKNGNLKPADVSAGSNKILWWNLPYDVPDDYPIEHLRGKHFDFIWKSSVNNRTKDRGCPFLLGKAIWIGFNDLCTSNPNLAKEWHPTRNGNLKPLDVTGGSGKKIWWKCPVCGCEWQTAVSHRTRGSGCPQCLASHGEKAIRKALEDNHIAVEEQYKFKDRFYKSKKDLLRDDFAIFDTNNNVVGTIEYHGQQHYEPVDFAGKGDKWAEKQFKLTQERDKIKSDYLKSHNIPQLIIPYWDFDNIKEIVKNFIDKLSNDYDL